MFNDSFSKQSDLYRRFRPTYPDSLFQFLADLAPSRTLAWDAGTGNGQAAQGLAEYFDRVIATDPSQAQIDNAIPNSKVEYHVEQAEEPTLQDHSVDLATAATALHWFDLDRFYPQLQRVLKPGGIFAGFVYSEPTITPEIDATVKEFHDNVVGPYWQPGNWITTNKYRDLVFPFPELPAPAFQIEKDMTVDDLLGWLRSWSATQRYIDDKGHDPIPTFAPTLRAVWGEEEIRPTAWPLTLKLARL